MAQAQDVANATRVHVELSEYYDELMSAQWPGNSRQRALCLYHRCKIIRAKSY